MRIPDLGLTVPLPVNLPWNGEATVIGVLIVVVLMISFGVLVPYKYVRRLETLYDYEVETNKRNTESLETLATATAKITEVGESVDKIMSALQQEAGERR